MSSMPGHAGNSFADRQASLKLLAPALIFSHCSSTDSQQQVSLDLSYDLEHLPRRDAYLPFLFHLYREGFLQMRYRGLSQ